MCIICDGDLDCTCLCCEDSTVELKDCDLKVCREMS